MRNQRILVDHLDLAEYGRVGRPPLGCMQFKHFAIDPDKLRKMGELFSLSLAKIVRQVRY